MRSMKAMAALAPQIKALQEKYKDDKQRHPDRDDGAVQAARRQPAVGLPADAAADADLARAVPDAVERRASCTSSRSSRAGSTTSPRPTRTTCCRSSLVVTMFVAGAAARRRAGDPSQKTQQKMMQYGMPLMFGVMSFFFPAGLTLYIFTNTCLSARALDLHEQVRQEEPRRSRSSSREAGRAAAARGARMPRRAKREDAARR